MATCNIQSLLDDAACFNALPSGLLRVAITQLWCNVADGIANLNNNNPSIQSVDDLNWYRTGGVEISPGNALFWMTQTQTAPGPNPELVIADPDTGDKYKVQAWSTSPTVQWQVDSTPTLDPETPTQITVNGTLYDLVIRIDGGTPLPVLEPA